MKCIIQVDEAGNPVNHPILIDNFLDAFPHLDISGDEPPYGYAWFTRKNQQTKVPSVGIKQRVDSVYERTEDGTGFHDVFHVRDLTYTELQELILEFENRKPFASWTLNTDTMEFVPPKDPPRDGNGPYRWNEETLDWIKVDNSNTQNLSLGQ